MASRRNIVSANIPIAATPKRIFSGQLRRRTARADGNSLVETVQILPRKQRPMSSTASADDVSLLSGDDSDRSVQSPTTPNLHPPDPTSLLSQSPDLFLHLSTPTRSETSHVVDDSFNISGSTYPSTASSPIVGLQPSTSGVSVADSVANSTSSQPNSLFPTSPVIGSPIPPVLSSSSPAVQSTGDSATTPVSVSTSSPSNVLLPPTSPVFASQIPPISSCLSSPAVQSTGDSATTPVSVSTSSPSNVLLPPSSVSPVMPSSFVVSGIGSVSPRNSINDDIYADENDENHPYWENEDEGDSGRSDEDSADSQNCYVSPETDSEFEGDPRSSSASTSTEESDSSESFHACNGSCRSSLSDDAGSDTSSNGDSTKVNRRQKRTKKRKKHTKEPPSKRVRSNDSAPLAETTSSTSHELLASVTTELNLEATAVVETAAVPSTASALQMLQSQYTDPNSDPNNSGAEGDLVLHSSNIAQSMECDEHQHTNSTPIVSADQQHLADRSVFNDDSAPNNIGEEQQQDVSNISGSSSDSPVTPVLMTAVNYSCSNVLEFLDPELEANRLAEEFGREFPLVEDGSYLVCSKGRWFVGRYVGPDANRDGRHLFRFSGKEQHSYPRCKIMNIIPELSVGGMARTRQASIVLKEGVNVCKRLVKGDIVQLTDGTHAFVYYNNHRTLCLMVLCNKNARRVCYSEVETFLRVDTWDLWNTKGYLRSKGDAEYFQILRDQQRPAEFSSKRQCPHIKAYGYTAAATVTPMRLVVDTKRAEKADRLAVQRLAKKLHARNMGSAAKPSLAPVSVFTKPFGIDESAAVPCVTPLIDEEEHPTACDKVKSKKDSTKLLQKRRRVTVGVKVPVKKGRVATAAHKQKVDVVGTKATSKSSNRPPAGRKKASKRPNETADTDSTRSQPLPAKSDDGSSDVATKQYTRHYLRYYSAKTVRQLKAEMALQLLPIATHLLQNVPAGRSQTNNVGSRVASIVGPANVVIPPTTSSVEGVSNQLPTTTQFHSSTQSTRGSDPASQQMTQLETHAAMAQTSTVPVISQGFNTSVVQRVDAESSVINGSLSTSALFDVVKEEVSAALGINVGNRIDPILSYLSSEVKYEFAKKKAAVGSRYGAGVASAIVTSVPAVESLVRADSQFYDYHSSAFDGYQQSNAGGFVASTPLHNATSDHVAPPSLQMQLSEITHAVVAETPTDERQHTDHVAAKILPEVTPTAPLNRSLTDDAVPLQMPAVGGNLTAVTETAAPVDEGQRNDHVFAITHPELTPTAPLNRSLTDDAVPLQVPAVGEYLTVVTEMAAPVDEGQHSNDVAAKTHPEVTPSAPLNRSLSDIVTGVASEDDHQNNSGLQPFLSRSKVQGKNGKFLWTVISQALANDPDLVIDEDVSGHENLWAVRLDVGCVVYVGDDAHIRETPQLVNAAKGYVKQLKPSKANVPVEMVVAFLKGYTIEMFNGLPKPVHFGYPFTGLYAETTDVLKIYEQYKEPFRTAIQQAIICLQDHLCNSMTVVDVVKVVASAVERCMKSQSNYIYYQAKGVKKAKKPKAVKPKKPKAQTEVMP